MNEFGAKPISQDPDAIDHFGLRLAPTYQVFKREMLAGLHAAGFEDLTAQHLLILPHIHEDGTPTSVIVERTGLAKQAVSRSMSELERLGYVRLETDPGDRRAKIVRREARWLAMSKAARPLKQTFHARVENVLGNEALDHIMESMRVIETEFAAGD